MPEEYRGIGVRIEDDILVTEDGNRNLSAGLPRQVGRGRGVDGGAARQVAGWHMADCCGRGVVW